jgi:DNA polymerase III delta subunit
LRAEKVAFRELAPFVRHHGRALGVELPPDAVAALLDACGDDLSALHDGISKLALYVEPGRPATVEDVQAVVAPSRQHSVFELIDAIGARDTARAFELVQRLADQGEAPLKVLGLFGRQIRQLIDLKAGRHDSPRLAGLRDFAREKVQAQADRFSMRDLVRALEALHRTDLALKSKAFGRDTEGPRALEALVLEIAGTPAGRAAPARGGARPRRGGGGAGGGPQRPPRPRGAGAPGGAARLTWQASSWPWSSPPPRGRPGRSGGRRRVA